jgi:undecaprenyl-diphosphatase
MTSDLTREEAMPVANGRASLLGRVARRWGDACRNVSRSREFAARRRRDLRFRVLPFDWFQMANAAALIASAQALIIIVLDPYVPTWQASLPDLLVEFFEWVTRVGKSDWILVSTALFFIAAVLADASRLQDRNRMRRAIRALAAGYVFLAVAISGILVNVLKYGIGRARPRLFDETGSFAFDFWPGDASWASFPSGHATTAMALGTAVALLFPRLRWVFLCLGFWVAMTRVFVRAHYPSDVVAGCLLGAFTAWLLARVLARRRLIFGFDDDGSLIRRRGASGRLS